MNMLKSWKKIGLLLAFIFLFWTSASVAAPDYINCTYNGCETTLMVGESTWMMYINCDDGDSWEGGGSGSWSGSLCGGQVVIP